MFKKEINLIFSSAPEQGAINKSADGSAFSVVLNSEIGLPDQKQMVAGSATLCVSSVSVLNNSPNISANIGNNILTWIAGGTTYNATIPDGLYDVQTLNGTIGRFLVAEGLDADRITIAGDFATNKIILSVKANTQLDLSGANSPRGILGFDSGVYPSSPQENAVVVYGDNIAAFDRVQNLRIKTNLIGEGIPTNSRNNGIIASIPILASPGSRIYYEPINPTTCSANELMGLSRNTIDFQLLDQLDRPASTLTEFYEFTVKISYMVWA